MIRIRVELLVRGNPNNVINLGTAYITNDATGTLSSGNYDVRLSKKGMPNSTWKKGRVTGFPRKRLGGWDLLFRALQVCVGDRN